MPVYLAKDHLHGLPAVTCWSDWIKVAQKKHTNLPQKKWRRAVLAQQEAVVAAGKAGSSGTRKEEEARRDSGTTHTPAVSGAANITLLPPKTAPKHDST